jgi:quinol monooxygenase YgiN
MIKVVAKHYIKPDKLDEYIRLSRQLVDATVQNDPGCISYVLFQDIKDPLISAMIEEWESMEAAEEHMKSKHVTELIGPIVDCLAKQSDINYFRQT